jgi:soluble lytic murein transglycosylase-like protein
VAVIENLLRREEVDDELRPRIAKAIIDSGKRHNVDPILLTSILVVESRGNPFAVSEAGAMGIMQIHLPTWGALVDEEGINLFKMEDNIDLGARILKGYIAKSGVWDGVARYKGRYETPESYESAAVYVRKVQRVYGLNPEQSSLD